MSTKCENEIDASWYARAKQLAFNCKFGKFVLNQFIMSLPSAMFERLCEENEHLSLSDALRKAMIMETKITAKRAEENVNYVHRSNNDNFKGETQRKHRQSQRDGWQR
ncbi:GD17991 [Drosophila simulans]|uniref:GD17991 n=1 Tax=Drosophila simulans TaxID=7240 RepID=B4NSV8_DROSI|nr:GD17991 [Drosophila simulans]